MQPERPTISRIRSDETSEREQYDVISVQSINKNLNQFLTQRDSEISIFDVYPGAERTDFDYRTERRNPYTTTLVESVAHMIKGCLGVGILCMHEAYMWGGLWTSLGTTVVLAGVSMYNTLLLVRLAQAMYVKLRIPKMSYPDLVEAAVGTGPRCLRKSRKCFRFFVEILLFVQLCSCCNIYQIMMASSFQRIIMATEPSWVFRFEYYILMMAVPIMLLCLIKKFKYLAPFTIIADIFIIICVTSSLAYGHWEEKYDLLEVAAWKNYYGFFRFCGVLMYAIEGTTLALPIENNMARPHYFGTVVWFAIPIVTFCCSIVGFIGYWRFGENCVSPITLHMPLETYPIVINCIFITVMAVSFALNFWVPLKILWRYVGKKFSKRSRYCDILLRVFLVLVLTAFSCLVPNIMRFMSVIGSVILTTLTFILPAFIDILLKKSLLGPLMKFRNVGFHIFRDLLCIALGFTLIFGGLYSFFGDMQTPFSPFNDSTFIANKYAPFKH